MREVLASLQAVQIEQHEECWDAGTRVGSVSMGNVLAYALATGWLLAAHRLTDSSAMDTR